MNLLLLQLPIPSDVDAASASALQFLTSITQGISELSIPGSSFLHLGWVELGIFTAIACYQVILQGQKAALVDHWMRPLQIPMGVI